MEENEKREEMFRQLVLQFQSAALIQLGQIKNPQTDKVEKNLNQAQYFIGMLDMLHAKTSGNLSKEDEEMLSQSVTNLKMVFVNESQAAAGSEGRKEDKEEQKVGREGEQEQEEEEPESTEDEETKKK